MKLKDRILSLILVFLMMAAAAITVNKTIFGSDISRPAASEKVESLSRDTITVLSEGNVVIHTSSILGTAVGYAGPVPLDIHIKEGRISGIEPLENSETPGFFKRASAILESWIGKTPEEALATSVDAVSGATYSSEAIKSNVTAGLEWYIGAQDTAKRKAPVKIWIAFAITLIACVIPLFVHNRIYRVVQMIANIVVLGFWSGQFLDYSMMLKSLSDGFLWPDGLIAAAMLIAALIYPLFGHPQHYCNHICPLGSAQQLMAEICGFKFHLSPRVLKGLEWFRRSLWAVLMLLLWADCFTEWMDYELFQAFIFESASWWIIGFALLFVLVSAVISRPYCRFVCPTGSLFKRSENFG